MGRAVLGVEYCLPSASQFTFEQTHAGSLQIWNVIDANGSVVYTMPTHNTNPSRWKRPIYETQLVDARGNILARIQDKKLDRGRWFKVLGADSSVLFSVKSCREWRPALKIFLEPFNLPETEPDYTVELERKKMFPRDYMILHGTQPMAEVKVVLRWFHRPVYTVTVNAGADCAFAFLLFMLVMKRWEERVATRRGHSHGAHSAHSHGAHSHTAASSGGAGC